MGRSVPNFFRAAVIACACAMLFFCVQAARAQSTNDDGYGFVPVGPITIPPGAQVQPAYPQPNYAQAPPVAAPSMPVQQAPMMPAQPYGQQAYAPPAYAQPAYAQAPAYGPPPSNQPPAYAQAPAYGPPQSYAPPPQMNRAPVSTQPYGYVALPTAQQNYGPYYASNAGENINSGYVLGSGDKVHVSVYGEDDLSGEYQIDGSGMVRLPLVGTIRAGGFTAPALGVTIAGALAQGYLKSPKVNVEITAYRPFYIIGAVNRPGNYPYVANMTALDAVALGGGFTDKAKESTVYVRHEGSTHEDELPAGQTTPIFPGDVVRVKTTVFWDAMDAFAPIAAPAAIAAAAF
jgi:protein involved in polysaccharide export with SLBB domain